MYILGAMAAETHAVASLIKYLQSMRGRRLWAFEDATLEEPLLASAAALGQLVATIVDAIFFEPELREKWAAEALRWMLECHTRHLACRSHQV